MSVAFQYARVSATSSEPDALVVDLHARLVADLRGALVHLRAGRRGSAIGELRHARRLFLFLNRALDAHADPHLAGDLHMAYVWALRKLEEGDDQAVARVLELAERLHLAWASAPAVTR